MRFFALAIALATSTVAGPAMAQRDWAPAPNGPWNLDYSDDSCALRRQFGVGEDQVLLEFRRFAPALGLQTIIASNRMDARKPPRFSYRFHAEADWRQAGAPLTGTYDNGFSAVIFQLSFMRVSEWEAIEDPAERANYFRSPDVKALELQEAAATDTLVLRNAFRRELTLRLGKLDTPIRALQACVNELMTHWNIDVEAHKTLSRPATPIDLADSSSMIDYPPKMLRQRFPGLVNIRLAIDETGRITGCHIQMPLSDPEFEESSCADIQHALEFEPALDKDGKPIASYWTTTVRFTLGGF